MSVARGCTTRLGVGVPPHFDLRTALFGHGFIDLPPHRWSHETGEFQTTLSLGRRGADVCVHQRASRLQLKVVSFGAMTAAQKTGVRTAIRRMLRLDEDLSRFHDLCRGHEELEWVARRSAGALLRSATPFEDLVRVLMTTNCTWANTRSMLGRLTARLGLATPSGDRAFPSPYRVARFSEAELKESIRVGYRARPLLLLARRFRRPSDSANFEELARDEGALREFILALPGFGPYAAGQMLRLTGHYRDFALDSWCVATLKERGFRASSCSERALARRYRHFGAYRGLAFWLDLTAPWHGEGRYADRGVEPLTS